MPFNSGAGFIELAGASNTGAVAVASTPALANGTAAQLAQTTNDAMIYFTVTLAGTGFSVAIGPTAAVANTIVPAAAVVAGQVISFRLPAGWFCKWSATTATIAQAAVTC